MFFAATHAKDSQTKEQINHQDIKTTDQSDISSDFISRYLGGNQLTGEIPSSIGNLVYLEYL
jgi:hypothetical protein